MNFRNMDRRNFIKGLAFTGIGSSFFSLALPARSFAARVADTGFRRSMESLGTLVNITVFGESENKAREAVRDAFAEIRIIHDLMSTHQQFSALSRLNKKAGSEAVTVDARITDVVRSALGWSETTSGAFDPTVLPLLTAAGFRSAPAGTPDQIAAARELVNHRNVKLEGETIGLERTGMGIDLGGIAKGYAVDRAASILRDKWGIANAIVDAGGDLYIIGKPEDAAGWTIGVKHPSAPGMCATFEVSDVAVATTGNYNTQLENAGQTYGDKFDPMTGEAVDSWLSTTVCAATCMDADAAAVATFIAGRNRALDLTSNGMSVLNLSADATGGLNFNTAGSFPAFERI